MATNSYPRLDEPTFGRDRSVLAGRAILLCLVASAPVFFSRVVDASEGEGLRMPSIGTSIASPAGFVEGRQDAHASIEARSRDRLLGLIARSISVEGDRPIDIRMHAGGAVVRPGSAHAMVPATARDRTTGAEADIWIEARFVIDGHPADADSLAVKPVFRKAIPTRNWGLHNLVRWEFAQRLRALDEADLAHRGAAAAEPLPARAPRRPATPGPDVRGLFAAGSAIFAVPAPVAGGLTLA